MSDLAALIPSLLPLRALDVVLRFRRETRLKPTHQPALTGFLRSLLNSPRITTPRSPWTHPRTAGPFMRAVNTTISAYWP